MNEQDKDRRARDVYKSCRNMANGVDMIKANHVRLQDLTSGMKLFKEVKGDQVISTYYDRIEIRNGSKLEIMKL